MKIESLQRLPDGIEFTLSDGTVFQHSYVWLRDHARDKDSFDVLNHQRLFSTGDMALEIQPIEATIENGKSSVLLLWPDQSVASIYPIELLRPEPVLPSRSHIWASAPTVANTQIEFDEATNPKSKTLLVSLSTYGFAHIVDCPIEQHSVARVANRIGYIRQTHFGGVWSFQADQVMADSAYSDDALRPHTDGTYYRDAPGLQLLMCVEEQADGGESILVDGLAIAQQIERDDRKLFAALCHIAVPGIYRGDGRTLSAKRPMFRLVDGAVEQISFNNYDRDRLALSKQDEMDLYRGIKALENYSCDTGRQWKHKLKPGEMIVFDNWRLLHGRSAFNGHRKMAGCYVNREEYESCLDQSF